MEKLNVSLPESSDEKYANGLWDFADEVTCKLIKTYGVLNEVSTGAMQQIIYDAMKELRDACKKEFTEKSGKAVWVIQRASVDGFDHDVSELRDEHNNIRTFSSKENASKFMRETYEMHMKDALEYNGDAQGDCGDDEAEVYTDGDYNHQHISWRVCRTVIE